MSEAENEISKRKSSETDLFDNRDCWRTVHTSQDQLISVILAFSRPWVKNSYTNAQLRAIAYTVKKRRASHLATATKLFT